MQSLALKDDTVSNDKMIGRKFGAIIIGDRSQLPKHKIYDRSYVCECDCGNVFETYALYISSGEVTCCDECEASRRPQGARKAREKVDVDGLSSRHKAEYAIWYMRKKAHIERGIPMDDEWMGSFKAFITAVGPRPTNLSWKPRLVRIDDTRPYGPGNCRWS